jgi:myosin-5
MRGLALQLQCVARSKMAKAQLKTLQEKKAAIILQKHWRRYSVRKQFLAKKAFIHKLQTGNYRIASGVVDY